MGHMSRKKPKSGGKKRNKHVKHNKMTIKDSHAQKNALKSITHIQKGWINVASRVNHVSGHFFNIKIC